MKRFVAVSSAALLVFAGAGTAEGAANRGECSAVAGCRVQAYPNGPVVQKVPDKTPLCVYQKRITDLGDWYEVKVVNSDVTGWILNTVRTYQPSVPC
ncbi:hypothetical protein [Amycolatopsis sp. NPDC059657]|uniref:hypothetical protein n=1 Tax=Amycolatopsis sp. NPDC059657 TaxID=3346899 RepID=UPI00366EBD39